MCEVTQALPRSSHSSAPDPAGDNEASKRVLRLRGRETEAQENSWDWHGSDRHARGAPVHSVLPCPCGLTLGSLLCLCGGSLAASISRSAGRGERCGSAECVPLKGTLVRGGSSSAFAPAAGSTYPTRTADTLITRLGKSLLKSRQRVFSICTPKTC